MSATVRGYSPYEIPLLHVLRSQLGNRVRGAAPEGVPTLETLAKIQVLERELEQLPYSVGGALHSLRSLEEHLRRLVNRALDNLPGGAPVGTVVSLMPDQSMPLCWTVDQFLDASRRAQNALTRYVARTFNLSLPQSLADVISKVDTYDSRFPIEIRQILTDYWARHGLALKGYRDLAQHYVIVSSDAYVRVQSDGVPLVHLVLPGNPSERSLSRISYGPPHVSVGEFCRSALIELFGVCASLTYALLTYLGSPAQITLSLLRHPMTLGDTRGFRPAPSDDLEAVLEQVKQDASNRALAAFGELRAEPTRRVSA